MAARMLREGAELDVVQYVGGWASPQMALIYGEQGRKERSIAAFHSLDTGVRPMRKAR
jgi:hypothetical protein